jgi:hypothetical protein
MDQIVTTTLLGMLGAMGLAFASSAGVVWAFVNNELKKRDEEISQLRVEIKKRDRQILGLTNILNEVARGFENLDHNPNNDNTKKISDLILQKLDQINQLVKEND